MMTSSKLHIVFLLSLCLLSLNACQEGHNSPPSAAIAKLYEQTFKEAEEAYISGKPAEARARWLALLDTSKQYLTAEQVREIEENIDKCSLPEDGAVDENGLPLPKMRSALYLTKQTAEMCKQAEKMKTLGKSPEESRALYAQALQVLEQGVREGERDESHSSLYGMCYLGMGDPKKALGYFDEAQKLSPTDPEPFRLIASCYEELGNLDEEISALNSAALLDGSHLKTHHRLAQAFSKRNGSGDKKSAKMHAEKAIGFDASRAEEYAEIVGDINLREHFAKVAKENLIRAKQQHQLKHSGDLGAGMTAAPSVIAAGQKKIARSRRAKATKRSKKSRKKRSNKRRRSRQSSSSSSTTARKSGGPTFPSKKIVTKKRSIRRCAPVG